MKGHDFTACELAMRALLYAQQKAHGNAWTISDLAQGMVDRFGISRATAYRMARMSLDVLAISYHETPERKERITDRRIAGQMAYWSNRKRAAAEARA